jgi:putative peptidoglycan lipid II flippase
LTLVVVLSLLFLAVLPHDLVYRGLALALSVGVTAEALWLAALLRRRLGGLDGELIASSLGRVCLAAAGMEAVMLAFLAAVEPHLRSSRLAGDLPLVAGGVAVGGATYLVIAHVLGAEELAVVRGLLRRRA